MSDTTLKTKVEGYTGDTTSESTYLADFLAFAANHLMAVVPDRQIRDHAVKTTVTGAGLSVDKYRIIEGGVESVNGYVCKEIPAADKVRYTDSGSLHLANDLSPVFWVNDATLYIRGTTAITGANTAGYAYLLPFFVSSDIVPGTATDITDLPDEFLHLVILDAAAQVFRTRLQAKIAATPTAPTILISATPPTALTTPSFTAPDNVSDYVYSAITAATALDISTQYTALGTDLDTNEDIELAQAKLSEIQTRIQDWNVKYTEALNRLAKDKEIGASYIFDYYAKLFQEEAGLYDAKVKRYAQELGLYQADIQKGLMTYQEDIAKYNANVAKFKIEFDMIQQQIKEVTTEYVMHAQMLFGQPVAPSTGGNQ